MALHNVVIKKQYAAYNIDALNRTAVCDADIDNGCVFKLTSYSENPGEGIVWKAEQAAATDKGLWMATSPEVVYTSVMDGVELRGLTEDPRAFYNIAGHMIDATCLMPKDIIEMTGEGIDGIEEPTNTYLVPAAADYKLAVATAAGTGMSLRKIGTSRLHIGGSGIAKGIVPTYKYEVEIN